MDVAAPVVAHGDHRLGRSVLLEVGFGFGEGAVGVMADLNEVRAQLRFVKTTSLGFPEILIGVAREAGTGHEEECAFGIVAQERDLKVVNVRVKFWKEPDVAGDAEENTLPFFLRHARSDRGEAGWG